MLVVYSRRITVVCWGLHVFLMTRHMLPSSKSAEKTAYNFVTDGTQFESHAPSQLFFTRATKLSSDTFCSHFPYHPCNYAIFAYTFTMKSNHSRIGKYSPVPWWIRSGWKPVKQLVVDATPIPLKMVVEMAPFQWRFVHFRRCWLKHIFLLMLESKFCGQNYDVHHFRNLFFLEIVRGTPIAEASQETKKSHPWKIPQFCCCNIGIYTFNMTQKTIVAGSSVN